MLGFLLLLILPPVAASPTPLGAIMTRLPFGWWHFLKRNFPQLTINWGMIGTGVVCSVLIIVLANWFLRALFQQFSRTTSGSAPPRRWLWRWTTCLYCAMWLLFGTAFGATGVLRHTTWLMEYHQPWYRMNFFFELRIVDGFVRQLISENNEDLESTRKALRRKKSIRGQTLVADEFNVIFYGDRSNKVVAYLIIPRDPQLLSKGKFGASMPGSNEFVRPSSELQQTIAIQDEAYTSKNH